MPRGARLGLFAACGRGAGGGARLGLAEAVLDDDEVERQVLKVPVVAPHKQQVPAGTRAIGDRMGRGRCGSL